MVQNAPTETNDKDPEDLVNSEFDSLLKSMDDYSEQIETQIDGLHSRLDKFDVVVRFHFTASCKCPPFPDKTFYGVKQTDKMDYLFEKFASFNIEEKPDLRFVFEQRRMSPDDTPESLGVESDEIMEIVAHRDLLCLKCYPSL